MTNILIFPNSLFEDNKLITHNSTVHIIEHPVYFTLYKYHKLKLILHRASMKYYEDYIKSKYDCKVKYYNFDYPFEKIIKTLKNGKICYYDPVDHILEGELDKLSKKYKIQQNIYDTPLFMNTLDECFDFEDNYKLQHDTFYKWQRKKHNILMTGTKPKGGKWTYDTENREPFPKNFKKDYNFKTNNSKYVRDAKNYVNKHFKDNPGNNDFFLPIDYPSIKKYLNNYLNTRLGCFGPYQDAVSSDINVGCHSFLSPFLNTGLLTPEYVVDRILKKGAPLESLEGIIRQIIGWREYSRLLYVVKKDELEKGNFFGHKRKLGKVWFHGTTDKLSTGFLVLDDMIDKAMEIGYLHHIERLMYVGNWFLINKIDPNESFRWFMECFIDSYNWVMYPNVYGMSQFSAGDIMMTRPYFSSSNYIDRMSNYSKNKGFNVIKLGNVSYEWYEIWDSVYYNFISDNAVFLKKNYATSRQVLHWNRKSKNDKQKIINLAQKYNRYYC